MKKLTASLALSAVLALSMNSALAAPNQEKSKTCPIKQSNAAKKMHSYQFMVSAKKGIIQKAKNGGYVLAIDLPNIKQVRMIGSRPNKFDKKISAEELKILWNKGTNSLAKTPPNASLTAKGQKRLVITLTGNQIKNGRVLFQFKLANKKAAALPSSWLKPIQSILLVIDSDRLGGGHCGWYAANMYISAFICCEAGGTWGEPNRSFSCCDKYGGATWQYKCCMDGFQQSQCSKENN